MGENEHETLQDLIDEGDREDDVRFQTARRPADPALDVTTTTGETPTSRIVHEIGAP